MVKGERQWQHASHRRSALMCHHQGGNPAGTDDRHLWRYDHETGEAAADHAEARQRDGRTPEFFEEDDDKLEQAVTNVAKRLVGRKAVIKTGTSRKPACALNKDRALHRG